MTTHRPEGLPLLLSILLAAALVTGCGGGDSAPAAGASGTRATTTAILTVTAPTLESAAAGYIGIREKYNGRIEAINTRINAAEKASEPGTVAIALDDLAQLLDEGRTDFDAIEFPPEAQAAAEEFARALSREATASRRFAKDIYDRDARDEFVASLAGAEAAGRILRQQLGVAD